MKSKIMDIESFLHLPDGTKFEIPINGSLGLLALGDIGLIAWRQKRINYAKSQLSKDTLKE